ncbi:MAG: hypothetical protein RLZZ385_1448 [Pseudomonadota bacterium]|jgi:aminopeptidase N
MSKHLLLCLIAFGLLTCDAKMPESPDPVAPEVAVPAPGVAAELARQRALALRNVAYDLHLRLPAQVSEPVTGEVSIGLDLVDNSQPLVLDFQAPADQVLSVAVNGVTIDPVLVPDHIVIPAGHLSSGPQRIDIAFRSTDAALNRQGEFMYALFVPDRASTAFPVFEQPDIKARFTLTLSVPAAWQAVSNGALVSRDAGDPRQHILRFAQTLPISTYLFSFAAGELQVESASRNGREFNLYHRETDAEKFARNRDAIFDLHATALEWLEDYTGIAYPFDKFDFFAVPAFQFGGMEHPGAIWYRAESLFLDPTASRTQELSRASLIAHETAHMWFGDLVTMEWFNDVWMKEVFANFMAAKIAGPAFPDLNLDLRFFQAHHPTAYAVDRTAGTNPIRQDLDNLNDAGSLYGAIIYQKAPVVMRQLEELIGEQQLRDGLRRYLDENRYGNAGWPDLIGILDTLTEQDLAQWSDVWVAQSGRPRITTEWSDGGITVRQSDSDAQRGLLWNQPLVLAVGAGGAVTEYNLQLQQAEAFVPVPLTSDPDFIFAGADGIGYGRFELDERSRTALLDAVQDLENPVHRAVVWQTLWEEMLDGDITPANFVTALLPALTAEADELMAQQLLGLLRQAFWQFLPADSRQEVSSDLEQVLWEALDRATTPGRKGAYFAALTSMTLSAEGTRRLQRIWQGEETPEGLPLQEQQYIALAEALALRDVADATAILDAQEQRISNPDRLGRFRFIRPALSQDRDVHTALFDRFADVAVRRQESWVLDAMGAIHHPLHNEASGFLLRPSLDLTEEILLTGDIFFPLNWLNATLGGYQSPDAAETVRQYLDDNPDLPPRLRGKVLQAADDLFRVAGF